MILCLISELKFYLLVPLRTIAHTEGSTAWQLWYKRARKCWGWVNDKKKRDNVVLLTIYVNPIGFLFLKIFFLVFPPPAPTPLGCHLLYVTWIILLKRECFITLRKPNVRKDLLSLLFECTYHSITSHPSRQGFQNRSYDLPEHFTDPGISVHPAENYRTKHNPIK